MLQIFECGRIDDTSRHWVSPQMLGPATKYGVGFGVLGPWNLAPRMIPFQDEQQIRPVAVRHKESTADLSDWSEWLRSDQAIQLPPQTHHVLEIEFASHSTAFWRMHLSALGTGAEVRITYSEAYEQLPRARPGNEHMVPLKGVRSVRNEGDGLNGPTDVYYISSRVHGKPFAAVIEPFW